MKYGYARVSTDDQSTALQLAAGRMQDPFQGRELVRSYDEAPGLC
jgi:hypothetical protein